MKHVDVLVRGAGIVGRCLALEMARTGLRVALRAPAERAPAAPDVRAYALNATSVALLDRLRVWAALPAEARTAVEDMRVEGDDGALLTFSAWEQRTGALAWIVDAAALEGQLAAAVRFAPHVTLLDAASAEQVDATLEAICDGSGSQARSARGVVFERVPYGQQAIAARLSSSADHLGVARQWFRDPDVLALLPLDSPQLHQSYALVWSVPDDSALRLLALDDTSFADELNAATRGAAGELTLASQRTAWPLLRAQADVWCGDGWVLLGDAAHVVHPLAGQGLNLGLGDVTALSRVIAGREAWRRIGDPRLLRRYARERLAPTYAVSGLTDALAGLFAGGGPAQRQLRNRGLGLADRVTPVKRWLTTQALGR